MLEPIKTNEEVLTLQFFPANNGDSFFVSAEKTNVLIDGGYVSTYRNFIKPVIQSIHEKKEKLDLVVVTHIDQDHISGINKLLEENNKERAFTIDGIWHNSYRHLQRDEEEERKYRSVSLNKIEDLKIAPLLKDDTGTIDQNISAKQGSTLARLIHDGGYGWNVHFGGAAASFQEKEIVLGPFTFKLLSPNVDRLNRLSKYWLKELYKLGYVKDGDESDFIDDAFEFIVSKEKETKMINDKNISAGELDFNELAALPFQEDYAVSNGSSISFVLEYGNVKLLFLGDSHPSVIAESLVAIYPKKKFPLIFDAIKVAHHGSALNTSGSLLELIDSKRYLFSTNGKTTNHPDRESIARIVSRKSLFRRTLYFNYDLSIINELDNPVLKERYNYGCVASKGKTLTLTLDGADN